MQAVTNALIRASDTFQTGPNEADRAMEWLKKAVAAGYSNAAQLAQDKDLDSLRGREDFQKLQAALEARWKQASK